MSLYNGPPRGGARGGAAEFSWENVKADKDRDYYLGHSVKASVGRWQKNKDIFWYTRDAKDKQQPALADEIAAVKQREADLMAEALGLKPKMVRSTMTARLDKQEMDALLHKQGSGAAEEAGEQDPDRIHGLGFAAGPLGGLNEEVHETLQGVGMGSGPTAAIPGPLPVPAGGAGPSSSYPPPPPIGMLTAQQLEELDKQDRRAAKSKKADKAAKKAKKKEHKKHKKRKESKHRSRSRSRGRSSSKSPSPPNRSRSRSSSKSRGREQSRGEDRGRPAVHARAAPSAAHAPSSRHGGLDDSRERHREREPAKREDRQDSRRYGSTGGRTRHDSPSPQRHGRSRHDDRHDDRHGDRHDDRHGIEGRGRERQRSPARSSRQQDGRRLERGDVPRRRHDSP